MTKEQARGFVLETIRRRLWATNSLLVEQAVKAGHDKRKAYRPIDRALQYHRKAGRIIFDGQHWRPTE